MEYVKKSLCDSSKVYKFDAFKDENWENRDRELNVNTIQEELDMRNELADQSNFKDEARMNLKNRNDDLMMDSMIQNQKDDQVSSSTNKRILKMNRKNLNMLDNLQELEDKRIEIEGNNDEKDKKVFDITKVKSK